MKALIDADIVAFSCGFAADDIYYMLGKRKFRYKSKANAWCDRHGYDRDTIIKHHEPGDLVSTLDGVDGLLGDILEATDANEAQLFLTGKKNFRYDIASSHEYKGNRKDVARPHLLPEIRDHLINHWEAEVVHGSEADDALGIAQSAAMKEANRDTVICSIDKDLLMIPGLHYNWNKKEWTEIDEYQGWYNFYKQMLTGDKTDNIVGVPGVGDKTAAKLLNGLGPVGMMRKVQEQYEKHFELPELRMLENANLLWIRREPEQPWSFAIHDEAEEIGEEEVAESPDE
jgi:hypothetical protein